jgi:hypothetical protein
MPEIIATILVPVAQDLSGRPGWQQGPLPLTVTGRFTTDAGTRSTYFDQRAAAVMYGQRRRCQRLHREVATPVTDQVEATALEWLGFADPGRCVGVLIVHVSVTAATSHELLGAWSKLVRWKLDADEHPILLQSVGAMLGVDLVTLGTHDEPLRVAFLRSLPTDLPVDRGIGIPPSYRSGEDPTGGTVARPGIDAATEVTRWAFSVASAVAPGSVSPPERQLTEHERERLAWSSDWSALVLRDGAAFIGHATVDPGFVEQVSPVLVRTVYTDALLLGLLQQLALRDLTDRLARLEDPARHPRAVERLDAEFSRFRNALWWQHLTHHGPGNELLLAFQRQHRLPELMEQTRSELEDYSRQAGLRSARVLNLVVTVFAAVGVLGVLVDLFQLANPPPAMPSTQLMGWSSGVFLVLVALVIAYTLGALSWLRPHRRPYRPRAWRRHLADGHRQRGPGREDAGAGSKQATARWGEPR